MNCCSHCGRQGTSSQQCYLRIRASLVNQLWCHPLSKTNVLYHRNIPFFLQLLPILPSQCRDNRQKTYSRYVARYFYASDTLWFLVRFSAGCEVLRWSWLYVCLCVCPLAYLKKHTPKLQKFLYVLTVAVLAWRQCDAVCTSSFVDGVVLLFAHNHPGRGDASREYSRRVPNGYKGIIPPNCHALYLKGTYFSYCCHRVWRAKIIP